MDRSARQMCKLAAARDRRAENAVFTIQAVECAQNTLDTQAVILKLF